MPIKSNRHNPSAEERDGVNLHWSSHFSRAYTICGTMSSKKDNASYINQEPPLSPPPRLQRHTQRVMMKHLKDDFLQSQSKWWQFWKVAIVSFIIRQITDLATVALSPLLAPHPLWSSLKRDQNRDQTV